MLPLSEISIFISKIEMLIRNGQSRKARLELNKILHEGPVQALGRAQLPVFASFLRRSGWPHQAVKVLHPWIRPKARTPVEATASEKAEYAAALSAIGADNESRNLLVSLHSQAFPLALLYDAFLRMSRWDYHAAIPLLEKFLTHSSTHGYSRQIAQANLAASWVATDQFTEAQTLMSEILPEVRKEGATLLEANLLNVQAQALISQGLLEEARTILRLAQERASGALSFDTLFIDKWLAVLELKKNPKATIALEAVRNRAFNLGHWETVRDCDFHLALLAGRQELLPQLYFGTPFREFREKITRATGYRPYYTTYCRKLKCEIEEKPPQDPVPFSPLDSELKTGQVPQRLFLALASDYYRPFTLPSLHTLLFPDRHYNPASSPVVVRQALKRLRIFLSQKLPSLQVVEKNGTYLLQTQSACNLELPLQQDPWEQKENPEARRIKLLLAKLWNGSRDLLTRAQAAETWKLPQRTTGLILREAVKLGQTEKIGSGPSTAYRFKP